MDDSFCADILVPVVMSQRRWQRLILHLVRSPAHSGSALNCGRENISTTHSILHFIPQTHQKTASSFCKLHFPRETAASPKKQSCNVITQESKKYQKVWVLLQKSSVSTNKCGAQTCLLIEKADGPIAGGTAVRRTVENKASAATTTHHLCRFNWETGSGVGTHKTQTEITIVASARHTDRAVHRNELYWVSGGGVVYPLHHQRCVCLLLFLW